MAQRARALPTNVGDDFFVDDSCIDCAACRWIAPRTFDEARGQSRVHHQPASAPDEHRALMAQLACPTASIGSRPGKDVAAAQAAWPDEIVPGVYHCGYHSEASFGAASYLLVREAGNVLVDSPRYNRPLARRLEALGGVSLMFLTHRDDVADHQKWTEHFGCPRVMHEADIAGSTRGVERPVSGRDPVALDDELTVIPVPGHTRGSACLLFQDQTLFTGDHLAYAPRRGHLYAFRGACWFSWPELVASTHRLFAEHMFLHVLPGHGRRYLASSREDMARQQRACLDWLATV